jgi:hypothetical protein
MHACILLPDCRSPRPISCTNAKTTHEARGGKEAPCEAKTVRAATGPPGLGAPPLLSQQIAADDVKMQFEHVVACLNVANTWQSRGSLELDVMRLAVAGDADVSQR